MRSRRSSRVRQRPHRARLAALIAAAVILLAVIAWAAPRAGTALVVEQPLDHPDALLALASHEWERLPELATLAKQYPDARVLLTLPAFVNTFTCHDCGSRAAILTKAGVTRPRIVILPMTTAQTGTHGEALAARDYALRAHVRRLMIVTSPYHTRRALAVFRTVFAGTGVELGMRPAVATSPARPERWWAAPYDRWYVRYEWAGSIYYWIKYGARPL